MFDQILFIDKPAGLTSFGVVARVRRVLSEKAGRKIKVGHTGTLDPFATGLLILMTGKNTKKCQEFLKKDKRYEATIKLGQTSTTGDPEGELTDVAVETPPTLEAVKQTLKSFTSQITQTVPRFSAVKIDGRRAYDLARKGETVAMPTRKVTIYEINLLSYSYPYLKIDCKVGSGTYIRSLAEDIGKSLGTGAYLTALRRTAIDVYRVDDALPLDIWMQQNSCQERQGVL